jgi:hypothetical protein
VVEGEHDGAAGIRIENVRQAVLQAPIERMRAFQIKGLFSGGNIEIEILVGGGAIHICHLFSFPILLRVGSYRYLMISAGAQTAGPIKDKFFRALLQSFLPVRHSIPRFS